MSKKGISLPVNVLVVLAIAIVVLLGVVAFFTGSLKPARTSTEAMNNFKACCTSYVLNGCKPDITKKGETFTCPADVGGTLMDAAGEVGITDAATAKAECGC